MKYKNIEEAMAQLEKCKFVDEIGHPIENNTAFIYLKKLADKFPCLIGDDLEVEVFGEIAGVKTSVKKNGRILKMEQEWGQPSGQESAQKMIFAYFYEDDGQGFSTYSRDRENQKHFKRDRIWKER